jgi:hypothetical protein
MAHLGKLVRAEAYRTNVGSEALAVTMRYLAPLRDEVPNTVTSEPLGDILLAEDNPGDAGLAMHAV